MRPLGREVVAAFDIGAGTDEVGIGTPESGEGAVLGPAGVARRDGKTLIVDAINDRILVVADSGITEVVPFAVLVDAPWATGDGRFLAVGSGIAGGVAELYDTIDGLPGAPVATITAGETYVVLGDGRRLPPGRPMLDESRTPLEDTPDAEIVTTRTADGDLVTASSKSGCLANEQFQPIFVRVRDELYGVALLTHDPTLQYKIVHLDPGGAGWESGVVTVEPVPFDVFGPEIWAIDSTGVFFLAGGSNETSIELVRFELP